MHIDTAYVKTSKKVHKRVLLRTSYREGKKVKHKTIANLSHESDETIEAIRFALKNKQNIKTLLENDLEGPRPVQGPSVGAIYVLAEEAKRLSMTTALGNTREGKLALWQILARIIDQGSRLSAVRLATRHAVCDILDLETFNEDDLYHNLDWIAEHQKDIEQSLFKAKQTRKKINLFLYDVTSSYTEGEKNAYSQYGYNRDKKRGKKQIVIGLLTDSEGDPVSIQIFPGNTVDTGTFVEQVYKVQDQFKVDQVIWVGDRGMIKGPQIAQMPPNTQYITAISKPQILTLLKAKKIKLEDFSEEVKEIQDGEIRYVLRRNPVRAAEMSRAKTNKLQALKKVLRKKQEYLQEHPRARVDKALTSLQEYAKKLTIHKWVSIERTGSTIDLKVDEELRKKESDLDGCYVIKSDVVDSPESTSQIIHDRYKELSQVEWAFRTMKTTHLEIRPYYVRREERTDAHVFIVMLAYKLIRSLREAWKKINLTVEEGISELGHINSLLKDDHSDCQYIPQPGTIAQSLLDSLDIQIPEVLPFRGVNVATRKKLVRET